MTSSIESQLRKFQELRISDPENAKLVHELNEQLVQDCHDGSFRKVKSLVESEGNAAMLMTYFAVRAFKAALMGCHLVLVDYLLSNGYPLNSTGVPYVLLEVITDIRGPESDQIIVSILQFLISKQWNVNMQANKSWVSALHMTVQHTLLESTKVLIAAGGDVNSVASGDVLPLHVAEQIVAALLKKKSMQDNAGDIGSSIEGPGISLAWDAEQDKKLLTAIAIKELLLASGARETWRRGGDGTAHGYSAGSEASVSVVAGMGRASGSTNNNEGLVRFTGGSGGASNLVRVAGGAGVGGLVRVAGGSTLPPPPPVDAQPSSNFASASSGLDSSGEEFVSAPSFAVLPDGARLYSTG